MPRNFDHRHSGHCETGTLSALFRDRGHDLSEALLFGLGGGLFFVHFPFIKMGDIPLTAYRDRPGTIIQQACKRLKVPMLKRKFRNESDGAKALDDLLSKVDIMLDAAPGGIGAKNKELYKAKGLKAIFQGGEKNEIADVFFHGYANYSKGVGADYLKLTSCNTTGFIRCV